MSDDRRTILDSVKALSPNIAAVVTVLYSSRRGRVPEAVPLAEVVGRISGEGDFREGVLRGALAILYAMGVVRLDGGGVAASSRASGFFLSSLSKFLHRSVSALDDKADFAKLTHVFETARRRREHEVEVDQDPLHRRHIVNIVIKGRIKRKWQVEDAYLHEYDADWRQYHLIGKALPEATPAGDLDSDKRLAHSIIQDRLRLLETQYALHPSINPEVKCIKHISETNGAYTEYSYRLFVVRAIDARLTKKVHLKEEDDHGPFRWFTWEEIQNCCSDQGEPIIFSTPDLLKDLDRSSLPTAARSAEDVRQRASILKELGNRLTRRQLAAVALCLVGLLVLQLTPLLVGLLRIPDTTLTRAANWGQVVSAVVAVGTVLAYVVRLLLRTPEE